MFLKSLLKKRSRGSVAIPKQTMGDDELLAYSPSPPEMADEHAIPFQNYAPVEFTQDGLIHVNMRVMAREQPPVQWGTSTMNLSSLFENRSSAGKATGFYREELGKAKGWELVRMSGRKGDGRLTPDSKEIADGCPKRCHFMRTGVGRNS